ncbi:MAG TPA: adenylyltransferase/cytidyltransferase family protein [Chthoniobacterales bacterium]|jgi:rfaE bifunctional protein nucleotidyltransferase chain/domain
MPAILALEDLAAESDRLRAEGRRLVLTNGCFDILHAGHVDYLERSRALGDALAIAINSDASVRALKGPSRPVNCTEDRARVLSALRAVDYVTVYDTQRATGVIRAIRPALYAKGGDYTLETLDAEERAALEEAGTEIHLLPLVPGRSTTAIIARASQPPTST